MIEILSLGGGVQSTAVLEMSAAGELPHLHHAIFADTGWERQATYDQIERCQHTCHRAGIKLHVVSAGNIRKDILDNQVTLSDKRFASIPLHVLHTDGTTGIMRRQCTREYKIEPIRQCIRDIIGLKKHKHGPKEPVVRQWYGISFDELQRMKSPDHVWIENYYPLVKKRITRQGCLDWLEKRGIDAPARSACIGCPFRSNDEWQNIRDDMMDWDDAVKFDDSIRNMEKMGGKAFLHRSCEPLEKADLRTDWQKDADRGQAFLWDDECEGMCGV